VESVNMGGLGGSLVWVESVNMSGLSGSKRVLLDYYSSFDCI
jgi:hypothetical protein